MASSDKSVELKKWSEAVGKNMELFKEGTEMMVRDHQKSNVKSSSFAIHLAHMASREQSVPVKHSLEVLSQRIDAIEAERLKVLAQLQALIVNKFAKYPGELKVQNASIQKRNVQVNEFAKAQKEHAAAMGNPAKLAVATGHLRMAEDHMRSSEDVLNKGLGDFEFQRVSEMKEFLRRYIRNQIYFHAKSIEGLTAAYQEVVKIDPELEKTLFLRRIREMEFVSKAGGGLAGGVGAGAGVTTTAAVPTPAQSPTSASLTPQQQLPLQYSQPSPSMSQSLLQQQPSFSAAASAAATPRTALPSPAASPAGGFAPQPFGR